MLKKIFELIKNKIETSRQFSLIISAVAFLIVLGFSFTRPYELFELTLYDLRFNLKPSVPQWNYLSFLNIDDHSINSAGQFPWPRRIYAGGMETLREAGARQVTYDIQFMDASPRTVDPKEHRKIEEKSRAGARLSADDLKEIIVDNDAIFAESLKKTRGSVLAFSFSRAVLPDWHLDAQARAERAEAKRLFTERASIPIPSERIKAFKSMEDPERVQIQYPIPPLVRSARSFGFVDSDFDIDGASRKIRLIRVFENRMYFNMALAMVMDLCGVTRDNVEVRPGDRIILKNAVNPVTMKKEDLHIPIDRRGMLYINWAGDFEGSFNHLSFFALLEYPQVRDEIHSYFDEEERNSGNSERTMLYGKLLNLNRDFAAVKELEKKAEIKKEIETARRRLHEIENGYAAPLLEEKKKIEEKLADNEDPELRQTLQNIKTYLTAINIVLGVEKLKDHAVIVGLTATATQDIGVTPLSSEFMMVGSYHNIANTILQRNFITKASPLISYGVMLILALIIGFIIQHLSATRSLIMLFGSLAAINIIIILLFGFGNLWVDQLGINLAVMLPSIIIIGVKFVSEESQKRFIKSAFSHYLSPTVIDQIVKNPDSLQLGGELRNITIYFSDVAGFSTISEKLSPQQLVSLLNEYLSEMTDIILSFNGTVDKYEGDAIIAFYGAPLPFEDHAIKACLAAVDMKKRLAEMRESWRARGQQELKVRMGMNTGNAVVGNMGSRTRMDYTMMGDAVNLAARLEGANKFYETYAMISHTTYEAAKDHIEGRKLDMIRVVGKEEPITVYELLGRKGQLSDYMHEMMVKYNEGMELFQNRDWQGARNAFRAGLKVVNDDGPCKVYVERCSEYLKKPPSKTWDGVYRLKTK